MVSNRINEGVGRKIVEALKLQNEEEIQNISEQNEYAESFVNEETPAEKTLITEQSIVTEQPEVYAETLNTEHFTTPAVHQEVFAKDLDDFEVPTNVAVLKQLINQLPAGVSKQTGAQIIKQTMEALGISMKSVLQEAQQVQESLNASARECQTSMAEYKKQIGVLEKQAQKYQRQYSALNDIISLFVQTSL